MQYITQRESPLLYFSINISTCLIFQCDSVNISAWILQFWKHFKPFYFCSQELEKAGLLNKTKIAEGGRKLRWGVVRLLPWKTKVKLDCICLYEYNVWINEVWFAELKNMTSICVLQEKLEPFLGGIGWKQSGFLQRS